MYTMQPGARTGALPRLLAALVLALGAIIITAGAALADGGPHGDFGFLMDGSSGDTDKCAACHRVHQGKSAGFLLKKATAYQLCVTCHDGSVSKLDVLDGVRLTSPQARPTSTPPYVADNATVLNGGGFEYVNGVAVTSLHNVFRGSAGDGGPYTDTEEKQPWGYLTNTGQKQSGSQLSQALTCSSCHNPHGSANYRMFVERINGRIVSVLAYYGGALTKQEGGRGLESGLPTDKYTKDYYASKGLDGTGGYQPTGSLAAQAGDTTANGFALLCGACHSTYPSSSADEIPGGTQNPWFIDKYRHKTEMRYTNWNSPKWGGNVPCNPETGPYNPSIGGCGGATPLPALRLASNNLVSNEIVSCLTCHRAHGTATTMTGWALSTALGGSSPDEISPAQQADSRVTGGVSKSVLLFTNNRAMCEACHQW